MKTSFIVGASSVAGTTKKINQDNILVKIGESDEGEFALFVVADGMGGLTDGEVASRICIEFLKSWWDSELATIINETLDYKPNKVAQSLEKVFQAINSHIIEYSQNIGERVGSTLSVLFILKDTFIIKHIGDSRVYRIQKHLLEQLTEDHSFVAQEVLAGRIGKEQARLHPKRNILTQCVGVFNNINVFESRGNVMQDDIFLLCSDGFYVKLSDEDLKAFLIEEERENDLDTVLRSMVKVVKDRDEKDNISVIVINIKCILRSE